MSLFHSTRREAMIAALAAGATTAWPMRAAIAAGEASVLTAPVETTSGKIRGKRAGGVSSFQGIPYGANTASRRFQPAIAPKSWAGVRDCFDFGPWAPQADRAPVGPAPGPPPTWPSGKAIASLSVLPGPRPVQSEDCLVLNVYTPDASTKRKRPVMVWLHGGGFNSGTGGRVDTSGIGLCPRGDVVVVTINHRLGMPGFLYLGALHDDFADSGNVGQLDILLALIWVRDNIAAFGGDAGNVTIFGESGGGSKVSVLMASPPAKGLFHKAIIESGPGLRMIEKASAADFAERTLAALGVAKADVHKLQSMELAAINKATGSVQFAGRSLAPVVDGRSLPAHPFDPKAPDLSRDIPLIIGTNKDEATLFMGTDPAFGSMSAEEARKRFDAQAGAKSAAAFEMYRKARPDDQPTYWVVSMTTDRGTWTNSIVLAERKAAQPAGVFMYRLDWETPLGGGVLRSPHGMEIPLVFDTPDKSLFAGPGPEAKKVASAMSQAWVNFARTGNPSQRGLEWARFDTKARNTMLFNVNSKVVSDPDRERREFWA